MVAAVSGKPIPNVAKRVLEEQAELIHAQTVELRLKHFGDVVRVALWGILAVAALAILVLLGSIVVKAARADALIVESFKVPPAMAQQGLTGDVVATQVLDKIAEFQAKTGSARAASSFDNNWGDDLKIDIPDTGATADQLWKLLRGWLGKETRISGEVIDSRGGLALTARVGSSPGQRFVAKDGDLDGLVSQAAELIFKQTQPYRYAIYLGQTDRNDESRTLLRQLTSDPSPRERKWAYVGLAVDLRQVGNARQAAAAARQALAIDPDLLNALTILAGVESDLGHDEAALEANARLSKLAPTSEYIANVIQRSICLAQVNYPFALMDAAGMEQSRSCFESTQGGSAIIPEVQAVAGLFRHDIGSAATITTPDSVGFTPVEAAATDAQLHLQAEIDSGSPPALAKALGDFRAATAAELADPKLGPSYSPNDSTSFVPLEAQALLKLGRVDEAAALVARTPLDCYLCLRVRGMVAEAQGNAAGAQRWYLEAAKQGPRLPQAFVDWGKLLIHARHFDGAIPKLAHAAELSPNWADPLKYWGDALAAKGRTKEALAKYDAALKLAPTWQELQQARARLPRTA